MSSKAHWNHFVAESEGRHMALNIRQVFVNGMGTMIIKRSLMKWQMLCMCVTFTAKL